MHLIIYFCGTGGQDTFIKDLQRYLSESENPNVKIITVEGCEHRQVCNTRSFPDLKGFAKKFTQKVFEKSENDGIQLKTLDLQSLKVGIRENETTIEVDDKESSITGITLCGYSRGAVTCFNVARELNKICPAIPVDIVANQPVPGNFSASPGTTAADIADCSDLTNLRNVSIILGAYTGIQPEKKEPELMHKAFFSQIVPKLPQSLKEKKIIVIPKAHHNQPPKNAPFHMEIAKFLKEDGYITQDQLDMQQRATKTYYDTADNFPTIDKLQRIFGIEKNELYNYIDPLHPTPHLRQGFEWNIDNQSLQDWWNIHEKEASFFASRATKDLIKEIDKLKFNNKLNNNKVDLNGLTTAILRNIYVKADKWLIEKSNSNTSRYQQVEALRNNIFHELVTHHNIQQTYLRDITSQHLHEDKFFKKRWENLGKKASLFKSEATRTLDEAFKTYAEQPYSKAADEALLKALNDWIFARKDSNSKRYDIVKAIHNRLEIAIKNANYNHKEPEIIPGPALRPGHN